MAVVRPFRAVTFSLADGPIVTTHTAPPYDVVGPEQRERLLDREPHNVVALELPEGSLDPSVLDNRYRNGAATWSAWREGGVLADDTSEAFYILEQYLTIGGRPVRRRAFIGAVDLEPFSAGVVLPHERTLPKALSDRLMLTRATHANLSQVLGLYSDPAGLTDPLLRTESLGRPIMEALDADGVESRVWALRDPRAIEALASALSDLRVFIADGHHRYTVSLAYRDECRAQELPTDEPRPWRPYDSVMMALVNMDDPELLVLPTHRIVDVGDDFDADAFWAGVQDRFDVTEVDALAPLAALADANAPATFVVAAPGEPPVTIRLRPDVDPLDAIGGDASAAWKTLDVAILQELVLEPLLGVHPDRPESLDRLTFRKDAEDALRAADEGSIAFLLRPTRMDQLREVAVSGEMMPQKSTYFYPKLLSGLLMRSLD